MNIKIGIPQVIVLWWFAMDSGILFYKYMNSIKDETEVAASIVITVIKIAILVWGGFFKIEHP